MVLVVMCIGSCPHLIVTLYSYIEEEGDINIPQRYSYILLKVVKRRELKMSYIKKSVTHSLYS